METKILLGYNQLLTAAHLAHHDGFSLPVFEDFNRFIEAVILYDKVVLLGDYTLANSDFISELSKESVFETLSEETLVRTIKNSPTVQKRFVESMKQVFGEKGPEFDGDVGPDTIVQLRINPDEYNQSINESYFNAVVQYNSDSGYDLEGFRGWLHSNIVGTRNRGGHFYYFTRSLIYSAVAEAQEMDYAPDLLRSPLTALAFCQKPEFISKQLYDHMRGKFQEEIEALQMLGMPLTVFIPPLTAVLLRKAPDPKHYASEVLRLREKFAPYRRTYADFVHLIKSPDVSLRKKLAEKRRLDDSIKAVIDLGDSDHGLNIKAIFEGLVSSDWDLSDLSMTFSISGIATMLWEQIRQRGVRGRAKALFDLWSDARNLKNYGGLIEKVFDVEINQTQVANVRNYSSAIRSIIRQRPSSA